MKLNSPDQTHLYDPATIEEPFDYDRVLRKQAPVYHDIRNDIYLVSSFELVDEVCRNHQVYSSRFAEKMQGIEKWPAEAEAILGAARPYVETLLVADPPVHTRSRALVNKALVPKSLKQLEAAVHAAAQDLVERTVARGGCEFREEFAAVLPMMVTRLMLRIPEQDLPTAKRWSDVIVKQLSHVPSTDAEKVEEARQIVEFQRYFERKLDQAEADPGEDLIAVLAAARREADNPLSTEEALTIIRHVFPAGHETTASAMTTAMYYLIGDPQQMRLVQEDPGLIPNLIEEAMRIESPTSNIWRRATCDTVLGGVDIPAGAWILIRFGSAARDESRFEQADRFDVRRANANAHLAFGRGIHACAGRTIARIEMRHAFEALFARATNFRYAPGKNDFKHFPSVLLRGLRELHVRMDRRA